MEQRLTPRLFALTFAEIGFVSFPKPAEPDQTGCLTLSTAVLRRMFRDIEKSRYRKHLINVS